MKYIVSILIIMTSYLSALDVRIGKGTYDTEMSIKSFLNHDVSNDILVFTLEEFHQNIQQTPMFYYGDMSLHTSDTKTQNTEFANFAASFNFPLVGSFNDLTNDFIDFFPVSGEYEAVGFDLNLGLGYDVLKKGESYLGIGLNVGVTLPTINAENLSSKVDFAYDLVESWELDVSTYKIGPAIRGNYMVHPDFAIYGAFSAGFQTASIDSGLFKSSVDVDGDYSALDLGVKYAPKDEKYFVLFGHNSKKWNVDSAEVNLYNFFKTDVFRPFTTSFKSSETYLGVGYRF